MAVVALVNQKRWRGQDHRHPLGARRAPATAISIRTLVIDIDPQAKRHLGARSGWDPPITVDHALAEGRPGSCC